MKLRLLSVFLLASSFNPLFAGDRPPAVAAKPLPRASASAEPWKGKPYENQFNAGALAGVGIVDGNVGFALQGTAAIQLLRHGFINDINDQVQLEVQAGPLLKTGTAFQGSLLMRWDFNKDLDWTLYGLGGVGTALATGVTQFYPRFGAGFLWYLGETVALRLEVSHELVAVGFNIPLL
jgi:hypothetical protein